MPLQQLNITQFRNIENAEIELHPRLNFFAGSNGAGKTSLLEAVYYLGRTRSFRCLDSKQLIAFGHPAFTLYAQLFNQSHQVQIGLQRSLDKLQARLNGAPIKALSQLADQLPILFISSDNQAILTDGPAVRRSFLDWGLFHSATDYPIHYRRFSQALRQRNRALKERVAVAEAKAWDVEIAEQGEKVSRARHAHFLQLTARLFSHYSELIDDLDLTARYQQGWKNSQSLAEQLDRDFERDRKVGVTHSGPHRDDFKIETGKIDASVVLSRGQQKRFNIAMSLAHKDIISSAKKTSVITLIDDISAEMDSYNLSRILSRMLETQDQFLVTTIEPHSIPTAFYESEVAKLFHVEHGRIINA